MIKAIFFDIDGTLLSYNTHQVSRGTIEAFEQLHRKGILTFISSGRHRLLIPDFPITFDGYITLNGGYCYMRDKVLLSNPISQEESDRWLRYVKQTGMVTMSFLRDELYVNYIDEPTRSFQRQLDFKMPVLIDTEELIGREVYQFIAMQPEGKDATVQSMLPHCRLPRWHPLFSDLIPSSNSKAEGMKRILEHCGLTREESMSFGDGGNDVEMIDYSGIGVVMGNALDDVKTHADFVTSDVDHEGIYHALKVLKVIE